MKGERGGFRGVQHEQRFQEGPEGDPYKSARKPRSATIRCSGSWRPSPTAKA